MKTFSTKIRTPMLRIILFLSVLIPHVTILTAQWNSNAYQNTPVCLNNVQGTREAVISDGQGGAIIAWVSENWDIYAQYLDSSGIALWTTNGIVVCDEPSWQMQISMVPDGNGGAIICWVDFRNGVDANVYAQRIDKNGNRLWATNGVSIREAKGEQNYPAMVSDGSGGAIVAWIDQSKAVARDKNIHIQHVSSDGSLAWSSTYIAVTDTLGDKADLSMVPDGYGGAYLSWSDFRAFYNDTTANDIYAQHINASGNRQWAINGAIVSKEGFYEYSPKITSDGSGGAIVTWQTLTYIDDNIYAQRLSSGGQKQWGQHGVLVCTDTKNQAKPQIISDGFGGAIISWIDYRNYTNTYLQRINHSGSLLWTSSGVIVLSKCGPSNLIPDENGGVILATIDNIYNPNTIYSNHIDSTGNFLWPTGSGVVCSIGSANKSNPSIISDQRGGAIIVWADTRNDINNAKYNLFAQRIKHDGILAGSTVKGNQIISFDSIPALHLSDGLLQLNAASSSGLPVSYTSSDENIAVVSGSMLYLMSVGSCTITAQQDGDDTHNPAPEVSRILVVNKGVQIINFSGISPKTLGDAPFELHATAGSLLPVVFSTQSDKISLNGNEVTMLEAGSVTVFADQAGGFDYEPAATAAQVFCINPPKPTITIGITPQTLVSSSELSNQWYLDGEALPGETSNTLLAEVSGVYTVKVSADNCYSEASEGINPFSTSSVKSSEFTDIKVYPNPAENFLVIDLSAFPSTSACMVNLTDLSGRVLKSVSGETIVKIDMEGLNPSIYLLKIQFDNATVVKQVVKK